MHMYTIITGTQYIDFAIEDNCVGKNAPMKQRYAAPHREYPVIMLSLRQRQSCSAALNELYCHLSVVLMRQNAQALLAHAAGAR